MVLDLGDCDTASVQADEGGARAQRLEGRVEATVVWKPGPENLERVSQGQ